MYSLFYRGGFKQRLYEQQGAKTFIFLQQQHPVTKSNQQWDHMSIYLLLLILEPVYHLQETIK